MSIKRIITLFILSILYHSGFSQVPDYLEYKQEYQFDGKVEKIKYILPSRKMLETFILKIEEPIFIKANKEWQELRNVFELHLNILNPEVELFENQKIRIRGVLFHALTIHHRRDACIQVGKIIKK